MNKLPELLTQAAKQAVADGFTRDQIDGHIGGNVHRWCARNVDYRPESEFFVVTLIAAAIADELARAEGYENQGDRAAKLAFDGFQNVQTVPGLPPVWQRKAIA